MLFIFLPNHNIKLALNQRKCEMNSDDELKAEVEVIKQQMIEAKKEVRANSLK